MIQISTMTRTRTGSGAAPATAPATKGATTQVNARIALLCLVVMAAISGAAFAQEHPVYAPEGIAIEGYDPVAYFTEGRPVEGSAEFSYEWRGAEWRFASREHLDLFMSDPERYAPEYGGYCAWAVGRGDIAPIDPRQWVIQDGRLFLNFSAFVNLRFNFNRDRNIELADENWPEVQRELRNR